MKQIENAIRKAGITELNEMQKAAIAAFGSARDIILLSPTGSGKTLAFLLPLLENLNVASQHIEALILTPSRELTLQTETVFRSLGSGFSINSCYGGRPTATEKKRLENPSSVLVGTPGRIADHIRQQNLNPSTVRILILDEFDKSLELGFREEMTFILSRLTGLKKRLLISATESEDIPEFTGIKNPVKLNFLSQNETVAGLNIRKVISTDKDKLETLFKLVCKSGNKSTLVFCNYRESAERIHAFLRDKGIVCEVYHGGMEQRDRERALFMFRNGSCPVLISTDLASRGLDIPQIENIIHYHLPVSEEAFVHRNGRTARMFAGGNAYLVLHTEESLPGFMGTDYPEESLAGNYALPSNPPWSTLYIGKGKKDKISKGDIAGFLMQKGGLKKDDLGKIEVKENFSYAAVKEHELAPLIFRIKNEKIKGIKTRFERAD